MITNVCCLRRQVCVLDAVAGEMIAAVDTGSGELQIVRALISPLMAIIITIRRSGSADVFFKEARAVTLCNQNTDF